MQLYHGTDAQFDGLPAAGTCGWVWWTDDPERAECYGAHVVERDGSGLRLINTSSDHTADWVEELRGDGVEIADLCTPDDPAECEPHQVLSGPRGHEVARRVRAAGFDGIEHWEDHPDAGEGQVVALAHVEA